LIGPRKFIDLVLSEKIKLTDDTYKFVFKLKKGYTLGLPCGNFVYTQGLVKLPFMEKEQRLMKP